MSDYIQSSFDLAPNAVIVVDANGCFVDVNPAAEKIFGFNKNEILGKDMAVHIVPEHMRDNHSAGMARLQATGETRIVGRRIEVPALRKSGEEFQLELLIQQIGTPEEPVFIGFANDLSQHIAAFEEMSNQEQEAKRSSQAKSVFLANMSHEIRTPLNGMLGMTSLLLETNLDPKQLDYLKTLRSSGQDLLTLINDILDFSKLESGQLQLEENSFSLRNLVEETIELFWPQATKRGLALSYATRTVSADMVLGDAGRLRQILNNFISNALKFTDHGGVLVELDSVKSDQDMIELELAVSDTGPGIPESKQSFVFDRFSQLEQSNSREFEGAGLGLAICRQLAELMGGDVGVVSDGQSGSKFFARISFKADTQQNSAPSVSLPDLEAVLFFQDPHEKTAIGSRFSEAGAVVHSLQNPDELLDILNAIDRKSSIVIAFDSRTDESFLDLTFQSIGRSGRSVVLAQVCGVEQDVAVPGRIVRLEKPVRYGTLVGRVREALGLTFEFEGKVDEQAEIEQQTAGKAFRILVVDDNQTNQIVSRAMLEQLGHRVDVCGDGFEAVKTASTFNYDLVFMDIHMPGMDGLEATRKIRASAGEQRKVPIIALTANVLPETKKACSDVGMNGFLQKPVSKDSLREAISTSKLPETGPQRESEIGSGQNDTSQLPLFDGVKMKQLISDVGEERIKTVLDVFSRELSSLAQRLDDCDDHDEAAKIAHQIKGASSNFGAARLQETARVFEDAFRMGDQESIDRYRKEFSSAMAATLEFMSN